MEFRNLTPFSALNYFMLDKEQQEYHVVAMKVGYQLQHDNGSEYRLSVIDKDVVPLCSEDEYRGAVGASQVTQESDLAPLKPRCDVIINGFACAPGGIACEQFPVSVRLVAPDGGVLLDKTLLIRGESVFERVNPGTPLTHWAQTPLQPFSTLEIDYRHALGGECRVNEGDDAEEHIDHENRLTETQRRDHPDRENPPVAHTVHAGNPLGCGYTERWYQEATHQTRCPAPRIVDAHTPFTAIHFAQQTEGTPDLSRPPFQPAGFGIVGRAWTPRLRLAGTYDEQWLEERHPYLPDDFDFSYWNGAPEDQQIDFPPPGTRVTLTNLSPDGLLSFSLSDHLPLVLLRMNNGTLLPQPMLTDTLLIDTQQMRVTVTCRYVLSVDADVRVMELRYETQPAALPGKMFPHREL